MKYSILFYLMLLSILVSLPFISEAQLKNQYVVTLDSGMDVVGKIIKFEKNGVVLEQEGYQTGSLIKYYNIERITDLNGNDQVFLQYDGKIKKNGKQLSKYRTLNLLESHEDLQKNYRAGRTMNSLGNACIGIGAFMAGLGAMSGSLFGDAKTAISAGLLFFALPIIPAIVLKTTAARKHKMVVRDFNNRTIITENLPNNKSTATLTFYGTGLVLTF